MPERDNRAMPNTGRFALALAVVAALAVAATVGTISHGSRDALPVVELLRVEPVPDELASPLDEALQFFAEILGGTRRYTAADLGSRFAPAFAEQLTPEELNAQTDLILEGSGAIRFVRVREREPRSALVVGVAEDGTAGDLTIELDDDGKIALALVVPSAPSRRLAPWAAALILVAGWALVGSAAAAWIYRDAAAAWTLLATSVPTLAAVLVLSDSSVLYTAGRAAPALVVVGAVMLLLPPHRAAPGRALLGLTLAAAAAGALAPFVRDASLIGHPGVVGSFVDGEAPYRVLLASAAGLGAAAMAVVATRNLRGIGDAGQRRRPTRWAAATIAATWAVAALAAAVDFAVGDGSVAAGPASAIIWSALAVAAAVVVVRLIISLVAQLEEVGASRARILAASDAARRRVERDLHDGAQQRLVALGMRLQRARRIAGSHELAELLEDATGEVRDAIEDIRAVTRGGLPPLLAERGLALAVDALAERAPVPVTVDVTAARLPAPAERTAYFVVAEGLTNMAKHAMATSAEVSITRANGVARVTISDDGRSGAAIAPGSGLEGLNDRVAATGGAFRISSGPGGTTLEATIPCA